jgi:hypothetical protein
MNSYTQEQKDKLNYYYNFVIETRDNYLKQINKMITMYNLKIEEHEAIIEKKGKRGMNGYYSDKNRILIEVLEDCLKCFNQMTDKITVWQEEPCKCTLDEIFETYKRVENTINNIENFKYDCPIRYLNSNMKFINYVEKDALVFFISSLAGMKYCYEKVLNIADAH